MADSDNDKKSRESARDTVGRTLIVAVVVSLVCSALVTTVAIALKPAQEANELRNRQRNILEVVGLMREGQSVEEQFEAIETRMVNLESGEYIDDMDPDSFDPLAAALNNETGRRVEAEKDIANLKRRALFARVYLVKEGARVSNIILPVRGAGLWSTMFGFVALEPDGNTIRGIKFYEHGETPGLGDQVDSPTWLALWQGKLVYDDQGQARIEVIRGQAPKGSEFQVDGMSGATLTGQGVTRLLQYWLGSDGFGPYLNKNWRVANG